MTLASPPALSRNTSTEFIPPMIYVGSIVRWMRPGKNDSDYAVAIVQRVNADGTLALTVIPPPVSSSPYANLDQTHVVVFHSDDPRLAHDARARYGCWDLTETDRQFRELQSAVSALQRKTKGVSQ